MFVETRDLGIGIGRVSVQWFFGFLSASPSSGLPAGERLRLAPAAMASFAPAGLPGVEIGGARFFHVRAAAGEASLDWSTATLPFSGLVKTRSRDEVVGGHNQLASAFFRVAPPGAGIEVYGELLRDDHNADLRDLIGEPDHISAYTLGVRRVWHGANGLTGLTIEGTNGRITHLARVRGQAPVYVHGTIGEGHTLRGQLLGSTAAFGGRGLSLSLSSASRAHSRDITFETRALAQDGEGGLWRDRTSGVHSLRINESRNIRGRGLAVTGELQVGYGSVRSGFVLGVTRRF